MMLIETTIPLLEEILGEWQDLIGKDYEGYKNHVYRMIHFCFALKDCNEEEREKVMIAGCNWLYDRIRAVQQERLNLINLNTSQPTFQAEQMHILDHCHWSLMS